MPTPAALLKAFRVTHHYLGLFIAPAVLFFAFTGFLQMFGLHETSRGSSYVPPSIIVHLAQLHKKATLTIPQRKPAKPEVAPKSDDAAPKADAPKPNAAKPDAAPKTPQPAPSFHWPMKIFFGLVAVGLILSTLTGLFMAWKYNRSKIAVVATVLAGLIIPLILVNF
jgi:hypothetical protein